MEKIVEFELEDKVLQLLQLESSLRNIPLNDLICEMLKDILGGDKVPLSSPG